MKLRSKLFYAYLLFLGVYAAFTLFPAPSQAVLLHYNLSPTDLRVIYVTLILMLAGIWFAGFYGFAKLNEYTSLISRDKDGRQAAKLTKGVFFLVMWLPVSTTLSAILNFFAQRHPDLLPTFTVIENYVGLALPLLGFVFISKGAHGLNRLIRERPSYKVMHGLVILVIYLGIIYCRLVVSTDQRDAVYHLSLWWILLTIAAPYIYMWFTGLISAYQIYHYQQKVTGIVYRRAWTLLALGIGWLITSSIGFQYLNTLTARLQGWSIYALLALVYGVLIVLAAGFIFIAVGARKLRKIEEV